MLSIVNTTRYCFNTLGKHRTGVAVLCLSTAFHMLFFLSWAEHGQLGGTSSLSSSYTLASSRGTAEGMVIEVLQVAPDTTRTSHASLDVRQQAPDIQTTTTEASQVAEIDKSVASAPKEAIASAGNSAPPLIAPRGDSEVRQTSLSSLPGKSDGSVQARSDLWKVIEPCWLKLGGEALPVTLKVSFSAMGNVSGPPILLNQQDGAISEPLISASGKRALLALQQCGPYVQSYGQTNVEIVFPAG